MMEPIGYFDISKFIDYCNNFEPDVVSKGTPRWAELATGRPVYDRYGYPEVELENGQWMIVDRRWIGDGLG